MSESFDPYHKWLGIPPSQQPPTHYRLLGLEQFEADPDVIDAAANQRMAYLQDLAVGDRVKESQKLLNEVSLARRVLLSPDKKQAYDADLKAASAAAPPAEAPMAAPEPPPNVAPADNPFADFGGSGSNESEYTDLGFQPEAVTMPSRATRPSKAATAVAEAPAQDQEHQEQAPEEAPAKPKKNTKMLLFGAVGLALLAAGLVTAGVLISGGKDDTQTPVADVGEKTIVEEDKKPQSKGSSGTAEPQAPAGPPAYLHFSPARLELRELAGLVKIGNEYQLYYFASPGHNPAEWTLGRASSADLAGWKEVNFGKLQPDRHIIEGGQVVVDRDNNSGLGQPNKPALILFLASRSLSDNSAVITRVVSTDNGNNWKPEAEPVLKHPSTHSGDPFIVWNPATKRWLLLLEGGPRTSTSKDGKVLVFASTDLKAWSKAGEFTLPGFHERPSLVPIPSEQGNDKPDWIAITRSSHWFKATLDKDTVKLATSGSSLYPTNLFGSGRASVDPETVGIFAGILRPFTIPYYVSLPTQLKFDKDGKLDRQSPKPLADKLAKGEGSPKEWKEDSLTSDIRLTPADAFVVEGSIVPAGTTNIEFVFGKSKLVVKPKEKTATISNETVKDVFTGSTFRFRIVVDGPRLELSYGAGLSKSLSVPISDAVGGTKDGFRVVSAKAKLESMSYVPLVKSNNAMAGETK